MASLSTLPPLLSIHGRPWKGVRYGCTTREGGVSEGEWGSLNLGLNTNDACAAVMENRRVLADALPSEPVWLKQVHGIEVFDADLKSPFMPVISADAAVTAQAGRVLAVLTADCAPVVMADLEGHVLGVAHAGWRGLAAGVLEATLDALKRRHPAARGWQAWVGPCIGQARFEVGNEVRDAFLDVSADAAALFGQGKVTGKWQADLAGLVGHRLEAIGVHSVETSGLCTYGRADLFYSYRRNAVTGRMATLAWLDAQDRPDLP